MPDTVAAVGLALYGFAMPETYAHGNADADPPRTGAVLVASPMKIAAE
jgi:hypothetical protein